MGLTGDMGLLLMSTILPIQNVRHHTYPAWSGLIHSLLHFIRVYFSSPSAPIEGITSTDTVQSFVSISTFCCTSPYGWKEVSEHLVTPLGFEPRTPSLKVRCSKPTELRSFLGERPDSNRHPLGSQPSACFLTILTTIQLQSPFI